MDETTIFDKVISGEIPVDLVWEDSDIMAFRDINPQAPVHVLVIPKTKFRAFSELKHAEAALAGRFITAVSRVAEKLGLEENGYRIVINEGKHGQQTVQYLHAHIIGGKPLTWPPG